MRYVSRFFFLESILNMFVFCFCLWDLGWTVLLFRDADCRLAEETGGWREAAQAWSLLESRRSTQGWLEGLAGRGRDIPNLPRYFATGGCSGRSPSGRTPGLIISLSLCFRFVFFLFFGCSSHAWYCCLFKRWGKKQRFLGLKGRHVPVISIPGNRLSFTDFSMRGPPSGWVNIRENGRDMLVIDTEGRAQRFSSRIRRHSFELSERLTYLVYTLVNAGKVPITI